MKILNLHGYNGSSHNAAYAALTEKGCEVISPQTDYDSINAHDFISEMKTIISEQNIDMLAGTSFGGFFAAVLSAELDMTVLLVNPCLMPFLHLPRLGYRGDIKPFIELFGKLSGINTDNVSCIIGGADEIIDTHDFTKKLMYNERFRIIPDGKHSGATLPLKEYFGEII